MVLWVRRGAAAQHLLLFRRARAARREELAERVEHPLVHRLGHDGRTLCTGKERRPIGAHKFPEATRAKPSRPGARAPWEWAQRASARRSQPLNLWLGSPPTKIEALAGRARRAVDSCQAPYRRDEATHAHPCTVREECGAHSSVVGRAVRERAVDGHSLPFSPGGSPNEQGGSCLFTITPLPLPFPFLGEGLPLPLPFSFLCRLLPYCVFHFPQVILALLLVLDAGVSRVLKKKK